MISLLLNGLLYLLGGFIAFYFILGIFATICQELPKRKEGK